MNRYKVTMSIELNPMQVVYIEVMASDDIEAMKEAHTIMRRAAYDVEKVELIKEGKQIDRTAIEHLKVVCATADEDCPSEYRSKWFNIHIQEAYDFIDTYEGSE